MPRRVWKIRGYDGERQVFEQAIPAGSLTDQEMVSLLQRLASRYLSDEEVVASSLKKNVSGYTPYLEVLRDHWAFSTRGEKFYYTAAVEDDG